MPPSERPYPLIPYKLVMIFLLLAAGIGIAGYLFYSGQKEDLIKGAQNELSAVSDLKINQIVNWRSERILDGTIAVSPPTLAYIREFMQKPDSPHRTELLQWLASLKKQASYFSVFLTDRNGTVRLSTENGETFGPDGKTFLDEAVMKKEVLLTDFHATSQVRKVHLDVIVPLFLKGHRKDEVVCALVMRIDPARFLYPLIQEWPTPSKTAESLLIRREDGDVVFLNELRHRKNTALSLRFPVSKGDLPAVMVLRGRRGIVEGKDYRGIPVLAVVRPIPDSPWFLVTKEDRGEVYAPIRKRAWAVGIFGFISILAAGLSIGVWWRQQQVVHYRGQCEAAEALRASEEHYRQTLDNMMEGCQIIGFDWRYTYINSSAARHGRRRKEDFPGRTMMELYPGIENTEMFSVLKLCMEKRAARTIENEFAYPGGEKAWFDLSIQPVPEGIFILSMDITGRKKAEGELNRYMAELKRSNEELQQFAYIASHDLQEPLRMISSYLQLIEKRYKDKLDKDADEFIAFAVDGANRLQEMIIGLLAYSRVGTKGAPFRDVASAEALGKAISNIKLAIEDSGALLTADPLPVVRADEIQLIQLFQNLISNAVKFRRSEKPHVHISAVRRNEAWVFSVKDNGVGIPSEYKDRIFNIFQRLHGREFPGIGIGLSICRRIVERHGGSIWFESETGKGTTFFFTIPIKEVKGDEQQTQR